jgi:dihydropyrimidinase
LATVLKGGTVVNATGSSKVDVCIEGENILSLGANLERPTDTLVDATGCYLFPGGIDPHTHFDLSVGVTVTADDFESGTQAAVVGGTTTVIDFATQNKGETLAQAVANWHRKADGRSFIDYGFHIAISDLNDSALRELASIVDEAGISSVKLYMAYKRILQVDDAALLRTLQTAKQLGILVCVHCENGDVIDVLVDEAKSLGHLSPRYHALTRPAAVEREAIYRAASLAEIAEAPLYVVHVSSGVGLQAIAEAQQRGVEIYGETCPQYLLLDASRYETDDFTAAKYVMSPPLRSPENQAQLWSGLRDGTLSTVGSDHCSFNFALQKELGRDDFSRIPNGGPGVENRFGLLYTYGVVANKIDIHQFVSITSTNAAKLFGLYPRKGLIAPTSDADIVVWDPALRSVISASTQKQRVDYNLYEGFRQAGGARHVFLRGKQIVKDGILNNRPSGCYLKRLPNVVKESQPCSSSR